MRAQNSIGLGVGHELYDAFVIFVGDGPAICAERKLPDPDVHPLLFREIFRDADAGELGVGVNDTGNHVVIHVAGLPGDHFDAGDAFFLGLVRQHRARDHVADRVDALDVSAEVLVHFHAAAIVERDAEFFSKNAFGKGTAADGDEHFVGFEFQFFAALRGGGNRATIFDFHGTDFRLEMESHALGGERFLQQVCQLEIEAECDPREKFEHNYFGAEPTPDRAKFKTDRATANDEKFLRRLLKGERLGAADDYFAVELHVGQLDRHAAGGDEDVGCLDLLAVASVRFDHDATRCRDCSQSLKRRDLVSLHQRLHAAIHGLHDLVFAGEHLSQIETDGFQHDAMFGSFLFRENVVIAGSEECFAWDAPYVEAGAAELFVLFDDGGLQAELRGANRRDISAGSRTDDDEIKFIHGY